MADNVNVTPGAGAVIATDECTINAVTVQVPRGKLGWGVDGSYVDASATNPLPVTVANASIAVTGSGVFNVVPASPAAASYLPVRLTDGTSFYTASGGGGGQQYAEDAAHASGDLGTMALAVRKDTATALSGTDGDYTPLVTDASGRLHVNVGNSVAVTGTFWQATQPVSIATAVPVTDNSGSLTVDAPVGTPVFVRLSDGTSAITTLAVSAASLPLPSGAATSALQGTGNTSLASIDTKTPSLGQALAAASVPVVLPAATITTLTPPAAIAGFALDATLTGGTQKTQMVPGTSGGLTPYKLIAAASTNATSVKASAGHLYAYECFNNNATSWRYLKLYDKATAPTVGTDTPVKVIGIPPAGGANFAFPQGVAFALGIAFAVTTGIADSDTAAVSASEVAINLDYK